MKKIIVELTQKEHTELSMDLCFSPNLCDQDDEAQMSLWKKLQSAGLIKTSGIPLPNINDDSQSLLSLIGEVMDAHNTSAQTDEAMRFEIALDESEAKLLSGTISMFCHPKLQRAVNTAFPNPAADELTAFAQGFINRDKHQAQPSTEVSHESPMELPNDIHVAVVSEADGDLAGYFILSNDDARKMDASNKSQFEFLLEEHRAGRITQFQELSQVLGHINDNKLELVSDFGVCAY